MLKKVILFLAGVLMLIGCGSDSDSNDVIVNEKPIVISHRGASGYLPEHTLQAYELAIQLGVDYIEPDLQFTSDGVLVAMHDTTLKRTTDVATVFPARVNDPVTSFTYAELQQLTVMPASDPNKTNRTEYPGYYPSKASQIGGQLWKIPTFEQVLEFKKQMEIRTGRTIGVYPEAKAPNMEVAILDNLTAFGYGKATDAVIIQSFHRASIVEFDRLQKERGLDMKLAALGGVKLDNGTAVYVSGYESNQLFPVKELAKYADGIGTSISTSNQLSKEFVDQAHAAGLKVHAYTFSKANRLEAIVELKMFKDMGIDGFFSNYPDIAIEVVNDSY